MTFTSEADAKPKERRADGLPCLGCGTFEASQWRGPLGRYCSKTKCDKAGQAARKAAAADDKDAAIAALTRRVDSQEVELAEQKQELAAVRRQLTQLAQMAVCPRVPPAASSERLALVDKNSPAAAAPPPPSKKARLAVAAPADTRLVQTPLPPGWSTRWSKSKARQVWQYAALKGYEGCAVTLKEPPYQVNAASTQGLCVQSELLAELIDVADELNQDFGSEPDVRALYERCIGLLPGAIAASAKHEAAWKAAWKKAGYGV